MPLAPGRKVEIFLLESNSLTLPLICLFSLYKDTKHKRIQAALPQSLLALTVIVLREVQFILRDFLQSKRTSESGDGDQDAWNPKA